MALPVIPAISPWAQAEEMGFACEAAEILQLLEAPVMIFSQQVLMILRAEMGGPRVENDCQWLLKWLIKWLIMLFHVEFDTHLMLMVV